MECPAAVLARGGTTERDRYAPAPPVQLCLQFASAVCISRRVSGRLNVTSYKAGVSSYPMLQSELGNAALVTAWLAVLSVLCAMIQLSPFRSQFNGKCGPRCALAR